MFFASRHAKVNLTSITSLHQKLSYLASIANILMLIQPRVQALKAHETRFDISKDCLLKYAVLSGSVVSVWEDGSILEWGTANIVIKKFF